MVCLPRVCTMTSFKHSDTRRDKTRCLSTYELVSSHYDHDVPKIDPTGPVPPYLQVAEIIRSQIRSGKLPTGSRITEAEITETYEVVRPPSAFQAGHIGRYRGSCKCSVRPPVVATCRWLLLLLSRLLSAQSALLMAS